MQLFNLKTDRGEKTNLVEQHPEQVEDLLQTLSQEVAQGRCTPGNPVSNDRDVKFLPEDSSE